jgi:hypothetical protein
LAWNWKISHSPNRRKRKQRKRVKRISINETQKGREKAGS